MRECGITPKEVKAGMGVPGPVLEDGSIAGCWNPGWGCFQLKEEAEMMPVYVGVRGCSGKTEIENME